MISPYFSVVIPAYNASRFIREALSSVLEQTFPNYEVIIVNDGSTDNTKQIIENIEDSRIQLYNIPNGGVSHARNFGISKAKGKYVAFLDSDDIWHPSHLEYAYSAFCKNPNLAWYSSSSLTTKTIPENWNFPFVSPRIISYFECACIFVNSSTTIIKRELLLFLFPLFPEDTINAEDWVAWARVACVEPRIIFSETTTVIYRESSTSATKREDQILSKYLAVSYHFQQINNTSPEFHRYCRWRARERWQIILAKYSTKSWPSHLKQYRSELGWITYLFLHIFSLSFFLIGRLLAKYLSVLNNYEENKRRRNIKQ